MCHYCHHAMTSEAPDLSAVPLLDQFFNDHGSYERFHLHVVGLTGKLHSRKRFGVPRAIDAVADPFIVVETVGPETGSADYFPIGRHTFPVLYDCKTPLWDAKCLLIAKKGSTDGIKMSFMDKNRYRKDQELFSFTMKRSELPEATPLEKSEWTKFSIVPDNLKDVSLEFYVMVTDGAEKIVSEGDTEAVHGEFDGYSYSKQVIPDESEREDDNAVLECWKKDGNTKAVFWVLGRNDCFMHPHVAKRLFFDHGYDLFVLNYKLNGICRQSGFVKDPHFNSHNFRGTFDIYLYDIEYSLNNHISGEYEIFLGYAHSTGGPVLLNYLVEKGDDAFDGFIFNSPFLDWGFVGGDMVEFVLENTGILARMGGMDNDSKVGVAVTPEALKDTPIMYRGEEIVFSDWSARLWSLYHFDFESRPLYQVPMTIGFAQGVTAVHRKLEAQNKKQRAVTAKPFLCITSRGDDVLKASGTTGQAFENTCGPNLTNFSFFCCAETLSRADWIGPGRWEIELNDNGHDVFLSYDKSDADMAIDMCLAWMKNRRLL